MAVVVSVTGPSVTGHRGVSVTSPSVTDTEGYQSLATYTERSLGSGCGWQCTVIG